MTNLRKTGILAIISGLFLATPTLAKGLVTVEDTDGNFNDYGDVEILSNNEILNIKDGVEGKVLEILKKDCHQEGEVTVCTNGTVILDTYGVKEAIEVKQMVVFTNLTTNSHPIKDSRVILGPKSIMAEILTEKGTYINISGKIDLTAPRP